ncbi:glycosyltransferase [Corynebacterium casei]|nr:glycosyltransferase [Corynebacterium casei]
MYSDEKRDSNEINKLKSANIRRNPDAVASEMSVLREQVRRQNDSVSKGAFADLKRRLAEASTALSEAREEIQELSGDNAKLERRLEALRNSRSFRVGYQLGEPVRFLRKYLAKADVKSLKSMVTEKKLNKTRGAGQRGRATTVRNEQTHQGDSKDSEKQALKEKSRLSLKKSQAGLKEFETELKRLWYDAGKISESYDLIHRTSVDTSQDEKLTRLIKQVKGEYRLFNSEIVLSSMEGGASYIPELGRVMYCVHSTPVFNSNGYSTRTRGVASGVAEGSHHMVVVSRAGYPWDTATDVKAPGEQRTLKRLDGVDYIHNPGPKLGDIAMDHYFTIAADTFVREARNLRPEVIQSASNHRTALPALLAARRVGVPFVYEVRGLWEYSEAARKPSFSGSERFELMKDLETFVCKNADKVLAITSQVAEELIARGVDRDRIELVPNGVDSSRFLPYPKDEYFAKTRKIDVDAPVIGFAGSIVGYEGLDLLVKASAKLGKAGIKHQIAIAGSGSAEPGLRKLAKELPASNVRFLGRLPQNQIPRLISTFDIVACPRESHQVTELVSPLKPLEAFASGRATILSDVAPNLELAGKDDSRALTFRKGDLESLVEALSTLIQDADLRRELGRSSRQWVMEERNWNAIGKTFSAVYKEVVRNRKAERLDSAETISPSKLKVGVIADEFTRTTIAGTFDITLLHPADWKNQFEKTDFDLIFVESAWEGNDGLWHRAVGFYSEDESRSLFELLEKAKDLGIPTVFWNKEDPVHFKRFSTTAVKFDYVFTTDANLIQKYLELPNNQIKSVSSMPFFAQPELHNPLVESHPADTYAFAGTYYGERYASRSKALDVLLSSAKKYGLEIFDRQASNPDSPYQFPEEYKVYVKGALPYDEVISTYASNIAHLNVSSVDNSPTMFSRRVAEIPACGGIVLSTPSRGIKESLGENIATSNSIDTLDTWLSAWKNDPVLRNNEAWRQMRTIYRAHTSDTALSILVRTIGLSHPGLVLPSYAVLVDDLNETISAEILRQSLRPVSVVSSSVSSGQSELEEEGIEVIADVDSTEAIFAGAWVSNANRTFYEDLLLPTRFGQWNSLIAFEPESLDERISPVFVGPETMDSSSTHNSGRLDRIEASSKDPAVGVLMPESDRQLESSPEIVDEEHDQTPSHRTILIAGHDLKFATSLIDSLNKEGHTVLIDKWDSHAKHDVERSRALLAQSDIVFCEWGLGNAVWYSHNVSEDQRLVVRVHLQEIQLPYLKKIDNSKVDKFIFVGELIRRTAILSHGVKGDKSVVIPNGVEAEKLALPKKEGAEFNIGFVGMIPQRKRLDLAIDLVERLLKVDSRYSLLVRGKRPDDYPWMKNRVEEMRYYDEQFDRIERINANYPGAVKLIDFGDDMEDWYRNVGVVVSTSDYESFHFTIADGAASGAVPVSLSWPGSDLIYPEKWLFPNISSMADAILDGSIDGLEAAEFIKREFDSSKVNEALRRAITNEA